MGRELTILERLRRGEGPPERSAVEDVNLLGRSVQANLTRLLNARVGHAPAQPEYGAPVPSEIVFGFPSAIERMQRHIAEAVRRFEPRLGEVEVIHVENDERTQLVLQFMIQARLTASDARPWVSYHLRMDPSGRITIRR